MPRKSSTRKRKANEAEPTGARRRSRRRVAREDLDESESPVTQIRTRKRASTPKQTSRSKGTRSSRKSPARRSSRQRLARVTKDESQPEEEVTKKTERRASRKASARGFIAKTAGQSAAKTTAKSAGATVRQFAIFLVGLALTRLVPAPIVWVQTALRKTVGTESLEDLACILVFISYYVLITRNFAAVIDSTDAWIMKKTKKFRTTLAETADTMQKYVLVILVALMATYVLAPQIIEWASKQADRISDLFTENDDLNNDGPFRVAYGLCKNLVSKASRLNADMMGAFSKVRQTFVSPISAVIESVIATKNDWSMLSNAVDEAGLLAVAGSLVLYGDVALPRFVAACGTLVGFIMAIAVVPSSVSYGFSNAQAGHNLNSMIVGLLMIFSFQTYNQFQEVRGGPLLKGTVKTAWLAISTSVAAGATLKNLGCTDTRVVQGVLVLTFTFLNGLRWTAWLYENTVKIALVLRATISLFAAQVIFSFTWPLQAALVNAVPFAAGAQLVMPLKETECRSDTANCIPQDWMMLAIGVFVVQFGYKLVGGLVLYEGGSNSNNETTPFSFLRVLSLNAKFIFRASLFYGIGTLAFVQSRLSFSGSLRYVEAEKVILLCSFAAVLWTILDIVDRSAIFTVDSIISVVATTCGVLLLQNAAGTGASGPLAGAVQRLATKIPVWLAVSFGVLLQRRLRQSRKEDPNSFLKTASMTYLVVASLVGLVAINLATQAAA